MRQWLSRHYITAATAIAMAFLTPVMTITALLRADGKLVFVVFFTGMFAGGLMVAHIRASEERKRDG